ncbi:hypothetical protein MMC08_001324, partial [Hypocenomyce scalaris]|nr:hypothetical protein [Hypocenomyce scalaris]
MDIHQVLAQNREKATPRSPSLPGEVTEPPSKAGILTRTLLRSPMVNWILPARIRHKNKNDVLFIGRDSVEVKELSGDCHLEDVAVKSDFGSTIRSARVLGAPVALPESYGLDAIIKSEELDEMVLDADGPLQIPPQILVLALESKMLVFLFAFYDRHDKIQYISSQRALPPQRSYLEQLGKHMAVDPKSRALAVAACEGSFCLYALKTMDQLREEIESDGGFRQGNFMPIREERHFSVEGIILKMEFLHPPQGENNHVILLLVISLNQRTRLLCYEWDCSTDLRQAKQKGDGQLVHPEDSHPLLLIPFTISSGFMLVCEKVISVYKGILTGPATRRWLALDHYEPPQDPGNSRRPPLWTHWAKPVRHGEYASNHNDIYLCREDGIVRWLEIDEASEGEDAMIGSQMYPGNIGCNIDTAFASLDQPTNRPDLLVSSGDTSNGGLFIIRPSQYIEPRATQTIHNWAPTIDFVTARVSSSSHGIQRHVSSSNEGPMFRERIFACTGRGSKHGAVSELRYGVEARIGTSVEIEDGVLDLWALSALSGGDTFVLLSYSATTMLLHIPSDLGNSESEIKLVEDENMGLYFDARTITAGVTTEDFIIQITESSIHVTSFVAAKHRWSRQCKEERIVAADICRTNPATVTALRRGEDVYLHLATLSTS